MKLQTLSSSGYFSLAFLLFFLFFVFTAKTIRVVAANSPSAEAGNLTLSVESVPVKNGSGPQSLLQRLNVRVSSAWSKFKCQFYTRATVPVSKMLNVKIPRSMELSNITNCHQLNVVVGQLANSTDSIVDSQVVGLESEASTARTNAADDSGTSTAKNNDDESSGPTTTPSPPSTEVVTEVVTTTVPPPPPPSTSSAELSSTTSSLSPVTTTATSAAPETTATSAPSTEAVSTSTVASVAGDNNSQSTTVSAPEELSTPEQKPVVGATN